MKAVVYHPSVGAVGEIDITDEDALLGVAFRACIDCWPPGSGMFELPDGELIMCGRCKGSAREPVMT